MPDLGNKSDSHKIDEFVKQYAGSRSIRRVLVANNGLAAVKCLNSIRQWLQKQFDTSDVVSFVCIATPDELNAASQYLKLADELVMAPGGKNTQNFASVDVIVRLALESHVDAVYVGWGHASENPELCRRLQDEGIIFIGPSVQSIIASGDKIVSTIIAQSIGMPTVTWSGGDVRVEECVHSPMNFHELRESATIRTVGEGLEAIGKYGIGVPMMIKASEGGGGKGIRKCERMNDFERLFEEVQIERRCQKVIEEAPATIVPAEILEKMKEDAIAFARFADYYSAGTVELLFVPSTCEYFFLELNPRLQVEHPCTEAVCDVNVPALQFQIAMGIRLRDIPDIQRYKKRVESGEDGKIHSIAARVTCEDPADRFLPSTGHVKSLKFGSTSKAWAYFSVSDGSTVHEYADSQIGHVFAKGETRSEAIANLKHALQNLKIDATFSTQSDYLIDLLSLEKFKENTYDTQWLDKRIANRDGQFLQRLTLPIDHLIAVSAAAIGRLKIRRIFEKYEKALKSGKIELPIGLSRAADVELQLNNVKYSLKVFEETDAKYQIRLGGQETTVEMLAIGSSGEQKIALHQGKSAEYQLEETDDFYTIKLAGNKLKFAKTDNDDASILSSPYAGKFLGYRVAPGEFVQVGQMYAQIELMKITFDLVVKMAPGRLIQVAKEGDQIKEGTVLARLEIDREAKEQLKTSEKFSGNMDGWRREDKSHLQRAKLVLEGRGCMDLQILHVDELISNLFEKEKTEDRGDDVGLPSESARHKMLGLFELFLDTESDFDARDGFDECVQRLSAKITNSADVVDRIHSNLHLKTKEAMICGILELFAENYGNSEEFRTILSRFFAAKQFRRLAPLAARILYKLNENADFSAENCGIDVKSAGFASSMRFRRHGSSGNISEQIDNALVAFSCFSDGTSLKFVANRVEIENLNGLDVEDAILEKTGALIEAEVKEIIVKNGSETRRFVNEIGQFLEEKEVAEIPPFCAPEKRDLKRFLARQNRTTYIYDFPLLFARIAAENAGVENWKSVVETRELIIENGKLLIVSDELELEKRASTGCNSCSVVAWLLRLRLTENAKPVEFVLIGNDVTHQVGSFAMPEHTLFEHASKLARQKKIPRINISCNSGARIGLARDVLDVLKVKLKANGHDFDYLYVEKTEKERIGAQIVYEEHGDELKLVAVKGKKNEFIGVENLMGSGAIGGETSRAYREIPTYCYVTGRSVGIGAYTARLARRIVQHEKAHLILTGAMALNTLLGKKVYASNNRLGGIEIMSNNGIAHATVPSDLAGIRKLVEWINYLPAKQTDFPFFKCFSVQDLDELEPVEVNKDEMQKDVRNLIAGIDGKQGIFDTNSFDEICSQWAASIVTGRAKLNGLAVGVIGSQWKSYEKRQLADESVEKSEETQTTRAGQVWYPDSAFKTSQAISDFNRESLPLVMIASLRGFSGGRKDMSDQVLTFGAHIIDELSQYTQPVIVYIPAGGELRGGAWAVVDSHVNPGFVHVIADATCRGGILEPNAVVGIKIREPQLGKLMERSGVAADSADSVKSAFKKAAVEFADMHDRWQRMEHVGAIRQVVELTQTRNVFWKVLRAEMIKIELARKFQTAPIFPTPTLREAMQWIEEKLNGSEAREYFNNGFWSDVRAEVDASRLVFDEQIAAWQENV
ncbi:unnamed protein product [Caenorhabditis sp. 36 PRJEB53466]|nr:unnamed protein product [Caenorhabditis sp. 36 PRJEB53466]